jgi:hypothetical protein
VLARGSVQKPAEFIKNEAELDDHLPEVGVLMCLAGVVLYLAAPLLDRFGHGFGILMAPLAVAEIVLAEWLIARGLNSPAPEATPAW